MLRFLIEKKKQKKFDEEKFSIFFGANANANIKLNFGKLEMVASASAGCMQC